MFNDQHRNQFDISEMRLYHFTSAESVIKIIDSMKLKFSSFENLNDLNEQEVNFQIADFVLDVKLRDFIIKECRLLSFSRDVVKSHKISEWGFDHPRMWAQYADNHSGACVVLNERKVLQKNKHLLSSNYSKIENVVYHNWIISDKTEDLQDAREILKKRYRDLFFKKHKDWKHEGERRLLLIGDADFLDIAGCIEYICLGSRFSDENYRKLIDVLDSHTRNRIKTLFPHDFALETNSGGRVLPLSNASKICELVKSRRIDYTGYLNKNGYHI